LDYCKPPFLISGTLDAASLWTWVPEDASWVYLIKVMGYTLVYVPDSDDVFFVNPAYSLKNSCPSNTIFLAQCSRDPNCATRLLVVDVMCDGGRDMKGVDPAARYGRLQDLQKYFVEPNCVVQWCGERDALTEEFLAGLPHRTRARVGFGFVPGELFIHEM